MIGQGKPVCFGCAHLIRNLGSSETPFWIGQCGWSGPLPAWTTKSDATATARWIWNGDGGRIVECETFKPKVVP